jgi:hypothetical protein
MTLDTVLTEVSCAQTVNGLGKGPCVLCARVRGVNILVEAATVAELTGTLAKIRSRRDFFGSGWWCRS